MIHDLGSIESEQGNFVPARWNEDTGMVELPLSLSASGQPHWIWITVGTAASNEAAVMNATNYLRGE
jgi:hypothetical protein